MAITSILASSLLPISAPSWITPVSKVQPRLTQSDSDASLFSARLAPDFYTPGQTASSGSLSFSASSYSQSASQSSQDQGAFTEATYDGAAAGALSAGAYYSGTVESLQTPLQGYLPPTQPLWQSLGQSSASGGVFSAQAAGFAQDIAEVSDGGAFALSSSVTSVVTAGSTNASFSSEATLQTESFTNSGPIDTVMAIGGAANITTNGTIATTRDTAYAYVFSIDDMSTGGGTNGAASSQWSDTFDSYSASQTNLTTSESFSISLDPVATAYETVMNTSSIPMGSQSASLAETTMGADSDRRSLNESFATSVSVYA